jgi:hypothetical protein
MYFPLTGKESDVSITSIAEFGLSVADGSSPLRNGDGDGGSDKESQC